jgi:hypothetical protein
MKRRLTRGNEKKRKLSRSEEAQEITTREGCVVNVATWWVNPDQDLVAARASRMDGWDRLGNHTLTSIHDVWLVASSISPSPKQLPSSSNWSGNLPPIMRSFRRVASHLSLRLRPLLLRDTCMLQKSRMVDAERVLV